MKKRVKTYLKRCKVFRENVSIIISLWAHLGDLLPIVIYVVTILDFFDRVAGLLDFYIILNYTQYIGKIKISLIIMVKSSLKFVV